MRKTISNAHCVAGVRVIEEDDDIALDCPERVGAVMLQTIYRTGKNGFGNNVMAKVIAFAGDRKIVLIPACEPWVISWYERLGFKHCADGAMER